MRFRKYGAGKRSSQTQRPTVKVRGVVETFIRERGWSDKLHERRIFDVWEAVVGASIAAQSVPVSLVSGVLRIEVAHQVYANELSAMKTEILTKLESKLESLNSGVRKPLTENKLVDIQFRLNPNVSKVRPIENRSESASEVSERVFKSVSPEMKEQIEAAVSAVDDFELRDALKTLFLTQGSDTETTE